MNVGSRQLAHNAGCVDRRRTVSSLSQNRSWTGNALHASPGFGWGNPKDSMPVPTESLEETVLGVTEMDLKIASVSPQTLPNLERVTGHAV